jgi:hypothetical protein
VVSEIIVHYYIRLLCKETRYNIAWELLCFITLDCLVNKLNIVQGGYERMMGFYLLIPFFIMLCNSEGFARTP